MNKIPVILGPAHPINVFCPRCRAQVGVKCRRPNDGRFGYCAARETKNHKRLEKLAEQMFGDALPDDKGED